jgi:hypothetical protein
LAGDNKLKRLILSILISALYLIPQLDFWRDGGKGSVFLAVDEPAYAARLTRVEQGRNLVGNPWTYEEKNDSTVIPFLPELVMGTIGKLLPHFDTIIIFARAVLPVLSFLIFAMFLEALEMKVGLATLISFWVITEPGLIGYKPFAGLLFGFSSLPLNRFANPIFPIFIFFCALYFWAKILLGKPTIKWIILGSVFSSLCFYLSIFYWTHLFAGILLFVFIETIANRNMANLKKVVPTLSLALFFSIPYWFGVWKLRLKPAYETYAWRNGLFLKDHGWYLLPHKTMWFFIAASVALISFRSRSSRLLLSLSLGGVICYFSSVLTGISLQNFHWHFTLAPLLFASVGWFFSQQISAALQPRVGKVFLILLIISAATAELKYYPKSNSEQTRTIGDADKAYYGAWDWLQVNASPDDVVVAEEQTLSVVPVRTGLRVITEQHLAVEMMPYENILKRFQTLWFISGENEKSLMERIQPRENLPFPQWIYGMNVKLIKKYRQQGFPALEYEKSFNVAQILSAEWGQMSEADRLSLARQFKIDILVRGPNEKKWGSRPENLFNLKPLFNSDKVKIDRILSWK